MVFSIAGVRMETVTSGNKLMALAKIDTIARGRLALDELDIGLTKVKNKIGLEKSPGLWYSVFDADSDSRQGFDDLFDCGLIGEGKHN